MTDLRIVDESGEECSYSAERITIEVRKAFEPAVLDSVA